MLTCAWSNDPEVHTCTCLSAPTLTGWNVDRLTQLMHPDNPCAWQTQKSILHSQSMKKGSLVSCAEDPSGPKCHYKRSLNTHVNTHILEGYNRDKMNMTYNLMSSSRQIQGFTFSGRRSYWEINTASVWNITTVKWACPNQPTWWHTHTHICRDSRLTISWEKRTNDTHGLKEERHRCFQTCHLHMSLKQYHYSPQYQRCVVGCTTQGVKCKWQFWTLLPLLCIWHTTLSKANVPNNPHSETGSN